MSTTAPSFSQKNTKLNVLYADNNGNLKSTVLVPPGTIVMWVGSEVPYGWALCNGENGTPNLINKFIKGGYLKPIAPISGTPPSFPPISGTTGGNSTIRLSLENLPPHKHNLYFSNSSVEPDHFHNNVNTPDEIKRTTVKHKHLYNINKETIVVDDNSSGQGVNLYKNTTTGKTSLNTHHHTLNISNVQSHNHICNIKFDSRSIVPSSNQVFSTPTPNPSPPHTNIIPSLPSKRNFSPNPINIEPPYYVLAFIMKL